MLLNRTHLDIVKTFLKKPSFIIGSMITSLCLLVDRSVDWSVGRPCHSFLKNDHQSYTAMFLSGPVFPLPPSMI